MTDVTEPTGGGSRIRRANARKLWKDYPGLADCVLSGFTVTVVSGLTLRIAAGSMVVNGTYVDRDVTHDIAAPDNTAGLGVWVGYDDANANTVLAAVQVASPGSNYQKVAECTTSAGAVTAGPTDKRQLRSKFTRDVEAASDLIVYGSHGASVGDTEGFHGLPTMDGTPTGTPAIGVGATVYDVTNKELRVWDGSAWQPVGSSWGNP